MNDELYGQADFAKVEPIDTGMAVSELIDRLRDEFRLADLNQPTKDGIAENLRWVPPYNMPRYTVDVPSEAATTRAVLQAPAPARLAVALLLRDLILPALTKPTEPGLQKTAKTEARGVIWWHQSGTRAEGCSTRVRRSMRQSPR